MLLLTRNPKKQKKKKKRLVSRTAARTPRVEEEARVCSTFFLYLLKLVSGESSLYFLDKKISFNLLKHRYSSRAREKERERKTTTTRGCASNNNIIIATMTIASITGWSPPISRSSSSYSLDMWYRIGTKWWPLKKFSRFATD
jgi:hypothetical protein